MLERLVLEVGLRASLFGGAPVKPEGRQELQRLKDYIVNGQRTNFSEYFRINDGYDYTSQIHGLEYLEALRGEPILAIFNHSNEGPLRGKGQALVMSHYVRTTTGQEIRYLHGKDNSTLQELARKKMDYALNIIPVKDPKETGDKAGIIREAFANQDSMGISPEGDGTNNLIRVIPSKGLLRAKPEAATIISVAAVKGYKLVCLTTRFDRETFYLDIDMPLENIRIRNARKLTDPAGSKNKEFSSQIIVDYVMAKIARNLPQVKRGYYQNFQDIIDHFEQLTAQSQ